MNEQSVWRLVVARKIAALYAANPAVAAILIGGSVARGCADRFSDVEIGVFWHELPEADVHEALMRQAGSMDWELDPFDAGIEDVQYEEYAVGGLKIDLRHMEVAVLEKILASVVDESDENGDRQEIVFVVRRGTPIYGEPLLTKWREKAAQYPDSLARKIVAERLGLPPWWSVPMYAERGDLPLFYHALSETAQRLLQTLCALNCEYYPGLKWLNDTLRSLPVQPTNAANRIQEIFRATPADAAEQMRLIIEETFDLAERHLPGFDLTHQRADFRSIRPIADAPHE